MPYLIRIILLLCIALFPGVAQARDNGTIRFGLWPETPPRVMISSDGDLSGQQIDLIHEIGKRLSKPVEIKPYPNGTLMVGPLKDKEVDVVIASYSMGNATVTEGLMEIRMHCYLESQMFVNKKHLDIQGLEDLEGKVVGMPPADYIIAKVKAHPPKEILYFLSPHEAAYALNNGEMDAWLAISRDTFTYISKWRKLTNIVRDLCTSVQHPPRI